MIAIRIRNLSFINDHKSNPIFCVQILQIIVKIHNMEGCSGLQIAKDKNIIKIVNKSQTTNKWQVNPRITSKSCDFQLDESCYPWHN